MTQIFYNSDEVTFAFDICFSVGGIEYFKCKPKYGSMVPVASVEIGDFPPEDHGLDDDEF